MNAPEAAPRSRSPGQDGSRPPHATSRRPAVEENLRTGGRSVTIPPQCPQHSRTQRCTPCPTVRSFPPTQPQGAGPGEDFPTSLGKLRTASCIETQQHWPSREESAPARPRSSPSVSPPGTSSRTLTRPPRPTQTERRTPARLPPCRLRFPKGRVRLSRNEKELDRCAPGVYLNNCSYVWMFNDRARGHGREAWLKSEHRL